MALSVDYGGDYQYVDGTETVSLRPRNPNQTVVASVSANRTSTSGATPGYSDAFSVAPDSVTWFLWNDTLSSTTPDDGDWIIDANSVNYVIQNVQLRSDGVQWRCVCTKAP